MARPDIEELFSWKQLSSEGHEAIGGIRGRVIELADAIDRLVPEGEEKRQSIRALREAMWWANSGISMATRDEPMQSQTTIPPMARGLT